MDNLATLTDKYQISMLASYWREGMDGEATFDLFFRRLKNRDYFLVSGVNDSLRDLEELEFTEEELNYLQAQEQFSDAFADWLGDWEFTCDVRGVQDGAVVYPNEPVLEVSGPIHEAQLVETLLLNRIQHETNVATKAAHIVQAADGTPVADFGLRRAPNRDAAVRGARAAYIGGVDRTSNVAAGRRFGIPITGTMAHSYVEAHDSEMEAFREFAETFPGTVVLIDTYDTLTGAEKVVELLDEGYDIGGVRLDSGDLAHLSKAVRQYFDSQGYPEVDIYASSGLEENKIRELLDRGAEIDAFGVGSKLQSVSDQPYADGVYKLCEYEGKGRMKLSSGKSNLPGKKQVYRFPGVEDVIATADEEQPDMHRLYPVMEQLMEGGSVCRNLIDTQIARMKAANYKGPTDVRISEALREKERETAERVSTRRAHA